MNKKRFSDPKEERKDDPKVDQKSNQKPRRNNNKRRPYDRKSSNVPARSSTASHNDPKWYITADQLVADVASYSFNNAVGAPIRFNAFVQGVPNFSMAIPGICVIHNAPIVGRSSGQSDTTAPINIAANKLYSFVRHENSGHANYDPNALMMYFLTMDSVFTMFAWMARIYGICMAYSQVNRYVGDAMIEAMGVNPNSIRSNLANFRGFMNMYAVKANAFAVPSTMSYFARHSWMYSNIYRDEDVAKSQFYMYNPAYLYSYEVDGTGVAYLEPRALGLIEDETDGHLVPRVLLMDYEDIVLYATRLLDHVLEVEDLAIMSGDVLKAYKDNLIKLPLIPSEYGITPVFSEEVLVQIHNTNFVGAYPMDLSVEDQAHFGFNGLRMVETTGIGGSFITYNPTFANAYRLNYTNIFDIWKDNPTPEDVLVGSRNMCVGTNRSITIGGTTYIVQDLDSAGSELCFFMSVYAYNTAGQLTRDNFLVTSQDDLGKVLVDLCRFNEFPHFLRVNETTMNPIHYIGELSNYTTMDRNNLNALHTSALLAMFGIAR